MRLLVPHLDRVSDWEVEETILADDVGLLVVPLGLEDVALLLDWLCDSCGVHLD